MTFSEKLRLVKRIDGFISRKGTGCYKTLAGRLGISVSSLYRRIDDLKSMGAEIDFCAKRQTYYYTNDFKF